MNNDFDAFFARVAGASEIQTQTDLARMLDVHRSAITQAKRKGTVPESWVLRLSRLLAVDADPNSCLPDRLGVSSDQTIGDMREELRSDPESVPTGVSKREWIEQLIHGDIAEGAGMDMLVMGRQEGPGGPQRPLSR